MNLNYACLDVIYIYHLLYGKRATVATTEAITRDRKKSRRLRDVAMQNIALETVNGIGHREKIPNPKKCRKTILKQ